MSRKLTVVVLALAVAVFAVGIAYPQDRTALIGAKVPEAELLRNEDMQRYMNLRTDFTRIPTSHPAYDMRRGDVRIRDGVVIERHGDTPRTTILFPNLSMDRQPTFDLKEIKGTGILARRRSLAQREQYIRWAAEDAGRNLSVPQRDQLKTMYLKLSREPMRLEKEVVRGRITEKEAHKELAGNIVGFFREQRRIFSATPGDIPFYNPLAKLKDDEITPELMKKLEKAYTEFLERPSRRISRTRPDRSGMTLDTVAPPYRVRSIEPQFASYVIQRPPISVSQLTNTVVETAVGEPTPIHYEFRVYTAEHSILPWWEDVGSDLRHVSVIAGAWVYSEQKYEKKTFQEGTVVATEEIARLEEAPISWLVGNGCASTYLEDDRLCLRFTKIFDNLTDLERFAYGVTKDEGTQEYFLVNACSYSIGTYGRDWVCHNLANAFSYRKWGIQLLPSDYSIWTITHGLYGSRGISMREDAVGQVHRGCIPGNWCFYTTYLPYADPVAALIIETFAKGIGTGLKYFWVPEENGYYPTYADYKDRPIPCQMPTTKLSDEGCGL